METKIIDRDYKFSSGISKVQLSNDMIEFLGNFNVIWMGDNTKYYNMPYWFKSTNEKNIFEVINIEDLLTENHSLKKKLNEIKDNITEY